MTNEEFWRSQLPVIEKILAGLQELPSAYAERALRDLRAGRRREFEAYFRRQFGLKASPEALLAFYTILTRSAKWRDVPARDKTKYLGVSVRREAAKLRKQRELDGVLIGRRAELERRAVSELRRAASRIPGPEAQLQRKRRAEVARARLRALSPHLGDRDKLLLLAVGKGLSPSEALKEHGLDWSAWQSLQRKARRIEAKRDKKVAVKVSSTRRSST